MTDFMTPVSNLSSRRKPSAKKASKRRSATGTVTISTGIATREYNTYENFKNFQGKCFSIVCMATKR
jgi:hypothetical protein